MDALSALDQIEGYRRLFTDVSLWTPYVRAVCQRHGLEPCANIRMGVPGSFPAFMVADRWLVKFFGRLFDGAESFLVEQEAFRLAALDPAIPIARILAAGQINGATWPWPYLVFELIEGISIGEVMEQVSLADRLRVAREMGELVRRLHALPVHNSTIFPADHGPYLRFLERQRAICVQNHRAWNALSPHLVEQIEAFLPPLEMLLDGRPPHLIHADLTRDHLLGRLENGRWTSLALIDFGDARTGSLYYELAALHLDLFLGDRRLLAAFLNSYGISAEERSGLPRKALATCLLHQFNIFSLLPETVRQQATLEELAQALWGPAD